MIACALLPLTLIACSEQKYSLRLSQNPAVGASPTPPPVALVFKSLQPAVAVRGGSCLSCHANIQSNVITDFGFGESYFLDVAAWERANGSFYFNHDLTSWQTASIKGSLIIPKVQLSRSQFARQMNTVDPQAKKNSMTLAELIQSPGQASTYATPYPQPAITAGVHPVSGPAVIEKSKIYIGAPTESEILGLTDSLDQTAVGYAQVVVPGLTPPPALPLSGLKVMGDYVANSSHDFVCAGDVVVKGVLFLNSPNIVTDSKGCRLYVSGSVFVQGQITYNGGSGTSGENLQITSARAIMMGFDQASLHERLLLPGSSRDWALPFAYTRGAGTNAQKAQAILDEGKKVSGLVDAGTNSLSYSHMLLNAPIVHSRYSGPFTGAIVGEIVIFRLGEFAFKFDSVFESVPIFPALKSDILKIED